VTSTVWAMADDIRSRHPETLVAPERIVLEAFLDDLRRLLELQLEDLTEDEARAHLVPSKTTLLGILQHAAAVERFFFQRTLAGRSQQQIHGLSDATDPSWDLQEATTIDSALHDYRDACEESRTIASAYPLDHVTTHNRKRGPLTLRWIYTRMIEELARHSGHADILREQILAARESVQPSTTR
jgi:hypothetical protein